MEEIYKELEDQGCEFVIGWDKKEIKKFMGELMKKIKESGDEKKIRYAKKLARYFGIFYNMGNILNPTEISLEEDKYGLNYVCYYLEIFVDTANISITGVIKAIADNEKLHPFFKNFMFTHMYTRQQVKEIGREEIYRRKKEFEEGLNDSYSGNKN